MVAYLHSAMEVVENSENVYIFLQIILLVWGGMVLGTVLYSEVEEVFNYCDNDVVKLNCSKSSSLLALTDILLYMTSLDY